MILGMAYVLAIAALLGVSALVGEKICADLRWPRRSVWVAALAGSLLLPALALLVSNESSQGTIVSLPFTFDFVPDVVPVKVKTAVTGALSQSWPSRPGWYTIDTVVIVLWSLSSALMLLFCAMGAVSLHRALRGALSSTIGGQNVVLSDELGPAVIGFARPRVVLPQWLAKAEPGLRSLVLAHEREHIAARDQLLLLAALLLVALMPWNIALWWQLKRLRAAIEVDCDARVLGKGADPRGYSEALLTVRQRGTRAPFGAVALTEPASELERRIRIMMEKARRFSFSSVGSRVVLMFALIGIAFAVNAPLAQQTSDGDTSANASQTATRELSKPVYQVLEALLACMQDKDFECAHERLAELAKLDLTDSERAEYWNAVAYVAGMEDDLGKYIEARENQLELRDSLPVGELKEVLYQLAYQYKSQGRYEEALEMLEQFVVLEGVHPLEDDISNPQDSEYLPLHLVQPVYPKRAEARRLQGYVDVQFTITIAGTTKDLKVVDSSNVLFERPALEAAAKYKYRPRVVDGEPVEVPGVVERIDFQLDD